MNDNGMMIDDGSDGKVFYNIIGGEEVVGGKGGVLNGVVNEGDETTPARKARAVSTDGEVVGEGEELGGGLEFCLLEAGY